VFLLVAVAAVTAATTGPIYVAAANQSVTVATLSAAAVTSAGIYLLPPQGVSESSPSLVDGAAALTPGGSGTAPSDRYGPAIVTVDVSASLPNPRSQLLVGLDIDARTDVCAHVRIVAGHCPVTSDDIILSDRSAALLELRVGSRIHPTEKGQKGAPLVVSGLYQPGSPADSYWWGENFFPYGTPAGTSSLIDDGFVTEGGAAREAAHLPTSLLGQIPLRASAVRATQIPQILNQLTAYEASVGSFHLVASTSLPGLLQTIELQEHQMRTIVAAVALELALLALLVLYQVAASNGAERSGDLEIAELRGLRRRSVATIALREPALLLAVATPAGLALAWLLVALISPHLFEPGTSATIDLLAVTVAILTFVAGFAAAALGSRSLLRPSLAREGRTAAERRRRRNAGLVDLLAVLLAAAAVVELVATRSSSTGGGGELDPLASLTPGALALVAGVLGARLLPLGARVVARATRWSPRVGLALASRSIMRRAGVARRVVVLVIAVGVLTFSVAGYSLARANRATQASFQVGAPVALTVHVAPGVNFLRAVQIADPTGHEAMAVAKVAATSPTIAVDSSRLAAVASWPAGTTTTPASVQSIARYLRPTVAPEVVLAGATAVRLRVQLSASVHPAPQLFLNVFDQREYTDASLSLGGPLRKGTAEVSTSLDGACSLVCRLDSISLVWSPGGAVGSASVDVPLVFSDVEVQRAGKWAPANLRLTEPGQWAQDNAITAGNPSSTVSVQASGSELSATFHVLASTSAPSIGPADLPSVIPSVVTTALAGVNIDPANPGQFPATGLDGTEFNSASRVEALTLPGLGANGALVDLGLAQAEMQGPPASVTFQVWCRNPPSAALLQRLANGGVTVLGTATAASVASELAKTAPSLAFDLFVVGAAGSTLLALGALGFSVASDSRRRSIEFAALAAVGVPLRFLRRSLVLEQVVIVVVGVVLGVAAGLVAGQLSLSLLPEFPPGRQGPLLPSSVGTGTGAALLAAGAVLVVLLIGGVVTSLLTMRRVRPDNVRLST
jgi:hypothetical protein